jgi:hypothetical protein
VTLLAREVRSGSPALELFVANEHSRALYARPNYRGLPLRVTVDSSPIEVHEVRSIPATGVDPAAEVAGVPGID